MTEEEELVETETTEAEVAETNTDAEIGSDITTPKEGEIDYEAELDKEIAIETARREKAERALDERNRRKEIEKELAQHRYQESNRDDDDDDKPLTRKELDEILARDRQDKENLTNSRDIDSIVSTLASSDAEKALVLQVHRNRTFPADMPLAEQVEEAYAIANRKKIIGERNEAFRALKNKASKNTATTHHDPAESTEPKIAADVKQVLAQQGFTFNQTSRRFEKKLQNGTMLVRDSKTGIIKPAQ